MAGGRVVDDYTRGRVRVRSWNNHDDEGSQENYYSDFIL